MRNVALALALSLAISAPGAHLPFPVTGKKAVVVFFMMTDCPLSRGYVPELNRIAADYAQRGVAVYGAHADPFTDEAALRRHTREFGYTFPVLHDPKLEIAKFAGAGTTPEVAVFSGEGKLLYLGRIDNRAEDITRRRPAPTVHDLRNALDAVLAGRAPSPAKTKAVGCSIPFEVVP